MARPRPVEVCFLIGRGGAVLWTDRSDDAHLLPDSRERWTAIWVQRDELELIAHSHPRGPLAFSETDRSTMAALDTALGCPQHYAVVAPSGMIGWHDNEQSDFQEEPWWADLLRAASGIPGLGEATKE